MHAGQYFVPMAYRNDQVTGFVDGPAPYFWQVGKVGG
jgi:hypothetical protein